MLFCLFNLSLFWHFRSRRHRGIVCVVPVVFSWTPYSWFQTRNKAELFVDKTIQSPPPPTPPPPLNLYKKSYIARGDNRWICSCHPTWPHKRQRTIKLRSNGKAKAHGAVYVSKTYLSIPKVSGTVHDGQQTRSWTPARKKQTNKQTNNKTLTTN